MKKTCRLSWFGVYGIHVSDSIHWDSVHMCGKIKGVSSAPICSVTQIYIAVGWLWLRKLGNRGGYLPVWGSMIQSLAPHIEPIGAIEQQRQKSSKSMLQMLLHNTSTSTTLFCGSTSIILENVALISAGKIGQQTLHSFAFSLLSKQFKHGLVDIYNYIYKIRVN